MMRILSIGNSFSQDAHKWLHELAQDNDVDLETVNLYIGGCSLKMHWENIQNNKIEPISSTIHTYLSITTLNSLNNI